MALDYEIKAKKIVEAEILAGDENKLLAITLENGSRIVGRSLGVESEENDDETESYDVLAFLCYDLHDAIFWFKDEEIKKVELVT